MTDPERVGRNLAGLPIQDWDVAAWEGWNEVFRHTWAEPFTAPDGMSGPSQPFIVL